ncbi:hypothetical protein [Spirosoma sordidisoli]|uniref:Uncharacterized protein n=1 Tax=Spirosoma sordidisoli TaxID=2502893 RepID=A0A4Q2UPW8_9BACT|nr:hypothetical protein [Spirosoma sordidisoli]RYC69831.1 hypothetical protein EQG79_14655 [Spirosoma sordidisoli]
MNWFFTLLISLALGIGANAQSERLLNKTWSYRQIALVSQQDTLLLFHSDSAKNIWYVGRVSLTFQNNHVYTGSDITGSARSGTWDTPNPETLVVGQDTNQIASLSDELLRLRVAIRYQDGTNVIDGTLITVFYPTPPVVNACESVKSGNWNDLAIWSCGHEPTITDVVIINMDHVVSVAQSTAQAQRIIYQGGILKFTIPEAKVFLGISN